MPSMTLRGKGWITLLIPPVGLMSARTCIFGPSNVKSWNPSEITAGPWCEPATPLESHTLRPQSRVGGWIPIPRGKRSFSPLPQRHPRSARSSGGTSIGFTLVRSFPVVVTKQNGTCLPRTVTKNSWASVVSRLNTRRVPSRVSTPGTSWSSWTKPRAFRTCCGTLPSRLPPTTRLASSRSGTRT